jgi:hypothetical protein
MPIETSNCLQVKTTNGFLTTIFKISLLSYLKLTTTNMMGNTLIKHKEIIVPCEESGFVGLNYNVLLSTLEANIIFKPLVPIITTKSA